MKKNISIIIVLIFLQFCSVNINDINEMEKNINDINCLRFLDLKKIKEIIDTINDKFVQNISNKNKTVIEKKINNINKYIENYKTMIMLPITPQDSAHKDDIINQICIDIKKSLLEIIVILKDEFKN